MPLEIRGAHFLIRSAQLLRKTRLEKALHLTQTITPTLSVIGNEMCRYSWHSAGSMGWPFPMLEYKYIFQAKYPKVILSNSTRKLSWFEITEMMIAV